ncbi:hypothetical protein [Puerhibacterium sp. TATVAM-FAB25]|uniref:hypothetical protein n=1 Tax=Puerhibacterium sp. TATVAM-FAB25 TaxID=3093699 RepID=UPI003979A25C
MTSGSTASAPGLAREPGRRPSVWAPHAATVDVVVLGPGGAAERRPMRLLGAHRPGWWGADDELAPGTDYGFSVDGGPVLADPAGAWQPHGVLGPSRVLDPAFAWSDAGWEPPPLESGVLLHVDVPTFTPAGTLDAAAAHLPAVAATGVQGVELAPLAAHDPAAGPAAGVRLGAVHEPYGGPRALQRFVDAAHAAGLAVVLGLPHRWAVQPALGLERFGPYAAGGTTGSAGPAGPPARINLAGTGSRGPRELLLADAVRWFAAFHVDGLVLDVEALTDGGGPPFLSELAERVAAASVELGRRLVLMVDGPGRSDRLTSAVARALAAGRAGAPVDAGDLRLLARTVTPLTRLPLVGDRAARRAFPATPRAASLVVGDLTRLPGAARAVPWPATAPAVADDEDERASLLAFAVLAGTPLVLDGDHLPVRDAGAPGLVAWCATLLALRPGIAAQMALPVDVRVHGTALVVRRGDAALVLATREPSAAVPLRTVLADAPAAWRLAAAWSPATRLEDGVLTLPGRCAAVLRAAA